MNSIPRFPLALAGLATFTHAGAIASSNGAEGAMKNSYVVGRPSLELDGVAVGQLEKAAGGDPVGTVVPEKTAASSFFVKKHLGPVTYDDINFTFGTGMTKNFYEWIKASMSGANPRKSGALLMSDYSGAVKTKQSWTSGLISEIQFPTLDAASKDAASIAASISPEVVRLTNGGAAKAALATSTSPSKRFLANSFRIKIPGLEDAAANVNKIESISVRFKTVAHAVGERRDYEKTPASADLSNLVITVSEAHAQQLYTWQEDFLIKGNNLDTNEKTVTIEILDPGLKTVYFTLILGHVGLVSVSQEKVESTSSDNIRRVRAEMYAETISFEASPAAY